MDVTDKVSLVTGAARRVGRAIALELAGAGCHVAVHYQSSAEAAHEVADEIHRLGRRAVLVRGDLADPAIAPRLVEETARALGRLDVLVNNASVFDRTPLDQNDPADWERILRTNALTPAMLTRAAAPLMRDAGAGRVVNLTDILANRPVAGYAAYCASKAALESLTRSLALELAPQITVNAIAPGIAIFPESYDKATRERLVSRVPLAREGTPEEIAAAVRFLVTSGDYVTGQVLPVDGGWSIVR